ncbi:MAG: hypothetical protein ACM31I_02240 [Deltaproteobacteria bacterium]
MSKFIPDPQIQSLAPMRAGDIAFAQGGVMTIGKQSVATAQPIVNQSKSLASVESLGAVSGPFNESPVIGVADDFTLSVDALQSKSLGTTNALEALAGIFNETPVIGVGTGTSVV